jgi:ABC-type multidrug transport system ATPase subunit
MNIFLWSGQLMIKFEEVSKNYYDKKILEKINIDINSGEFVLLVGDNGTGKSTLLKLLSHVIYPSCKKIIKSDMFNAYLPEKFSLPKTLTVKEFVDFLESYFVKNLYDYLTYLDIPNKRIGSLSKGNLQKLGLLTVIASNNNTILLDEPCEGMDESLKKKFIEILKKLKNSKTIIISTHSPSFYKTFKPRILYFKDGNIYEKNSHASINI